MGFVAKNVTLIVLLYCQVCNFTHIVWPQAFQHYLMGKILFFFGNYFVVARLRGCGCGCGCGCGLQV